ncbi:alpha-hydroxy-acid oxidizing protein [Salinibacterium sp. UTAS2018]|uniref:alpha-hydroxy acid oxidase n=1 Tax=Salinibacterium sp. UTAS2018 TaxID=2508880 RepID=UPI001009668B|nr:alpha-hydroxy acid oxidase [Salinibacterium sp. UTAS2018]QAV70857.1 alpha-hydroxy-acid oxidizing protein [Salinibacterium sp. UTAS2018]
MVKRQFPNPVELAKLMKFKAPELNGKKRRLDGALTIYDLKDIAKRRTPKAAYDYTDGSAEGEISLSRARQAFEDIEFHPSILRDASNVSTTTQILGGTSAMPFGIAPTGFTRLMQTEGEIAGAGAAAAAGIPFTLSTLGTTSIEDVKAENPNGRNWFQLYVMREREISYGLVERAAAAGYDTLMFTVDTPVAGARLRDKRNGFSIPPQLTAGTILNAIPRPWWWFDFLTTPPLEFASLATTGGTVGELLDSAMDPSINYEDLEIIRAMWPGKIVIKGVQNLEDSKRLAALGVDGILLSNHGGRQLDRAPIPFHLLPEVAREVGNDVEVMVDTGIMNGADVVASMALGAKFTLIGRAYLYGLMAGGRQGVDRTIEILSDQIVRTMKLLEVTSIEELEPKHVTQLQRLAPRAVAPSAAAAVPAKRAAPRKAAASASAAAAAKAAPTKAAAKKPATKKAAVKK